jgi:hypothetical protein
MMYEKKKKSKKFIVVQNIFLIQLYIEYSYTSNKIKTTIEQDSI